MITDGIAEEKACYNREDMHRIRNWKRHAGGERNGEYFKRRRVTLC